ncbi:MAG: methyl-accepting chemotaxis protein, partial [Lachnospiraceae bacterium]|nr:methyl-accepting chemotaxis protein [Lachnospiraceae bacterium]
MSKTKKKGNFLNFKGMRIEERLRKAFNIIIAIASVASVVGIICLLVVVANFKSAMNNYALPQGDIALFMNEYAESRSNTRGIIGYEDQDLIDQLVDKHDDRVKNTRARYEAIHETIVTKEGETAYAAIGTALEAYLAKEAEIIKIGATTDQEQCRIAQDMAINDLTPLYEELDRATLALMNINIEKEHQMELHCAIIEWGSVILMAILVLTAGIIAKRIAHIISKGISKPLAQLEDRFGTFAEGDIKSEFPTSNAQDEIAGLMNSSHDMAERLKMIILDVERMCAEMSGGNFNVESDCADAYVGDLAELYVSIKNMNINVSNALSEVEEVSNQVNGGASNLAEAASSLA